MLYYFLAWKNVFLSRRGEIICLRLFGNMSRWSCSGKNCEALGH